MLGFEFCYTGHVNARNEYYLDMCFTSDKAIFKFKNIIGETTCRSRGRSID
ncbi:MAG: hypothetical protein JJE21_05155 [Spirochaetaceae bacterium]|nr:hypothetical protein [Spirochaetaceae bacterium]